MTLPSTTHQKALTPIEQVRTDLSKMELQFKMALPPNVSAEKFIRVTVTALQNAPDLLNCDRQSLFSSAMKCAQDGLLPDGREAAFVKYGNKVQYLPMVGGILKKVRNSGELASINSQVVYAEDDFDYWLDENGEHLKHKPKLDGNRGERRLTYAIARTKDGAIYLEVMTEDQMKDVRNVSRAKDSGPWNGPFADEMRRKTAIRRLSKRLPMSTDEDLERVIKRDDELYDVKSTQESLNKLTALQEKLHNQSQPQLQQETPNEQQESEFDKFHGEIVQPEEPKVVK